jgi:membrane associated rhomboid family serine protease
MSAARWNPSPKTRRAALAAGLTYDYDAGSRPLYPPTSGAMGIHNRDYYRETMPAGWGETFTPVVKWLLIANIAVFLLQIFITREESPSFLDQMRKFDRDLDRWLDEKEEGSTEADEKIKKKYPNLDKQLEQWEKTVAYLPGQRISVVQEWFELDTPKVVYSGQVWRLLTCAFCHDRLGVWHIVFNMLCLVWFGPTLERMYGGREFLLFYLTSALAASLAFVALDLYTGSKIPAVGASGAVMGVMMLYTMHFPYETITIFWVVRLEMRWIMLFYLIFDLHPVLLALAGDSMFGGMGGVAHAAHLGGLAFGFLYAHYQWRLEPLIGRVGIPSFKLRRRPRLRLAPETLPDDDLPADDEMARVDAVLQKIFESGQASLTEEERALLKRASERLKNR